jgi:hypothetical protein
MLQQAARERADAGHHELWTAWKFDAAAPAHENALARAVAAGTGCRRQRYVTHAVADALGEKHRLTEPVRRN